METSGERCGGKVRGFAVGELHRRAPKWKGPRDEWLVCEDVKIPELTSGTFCVEVDTDCWLTGRRLLTVH